MERVVERQAEARSVPARTLARVFLRSLLLQASWNRRGMQNLGFAWAIWPALVHLYPDPARRSGAARRHLAFFNSHPYLASAILGGSIYLEERVARGEAPPETVERFKNALMGPFAAVGDSFFWLSLRPCAGAIAALAAPLVGLWAVAIFLALYNVPHLALRLLLFVEGYRGGDRVVERVAQAKLPARGALLRRIAACGGGAAAVVGIGSTLGPSDPLAAIAASLAGAAAFGIAWKIAGREALLAGAVAIALGTLLALVGGAP